MDLLTILDNLVCRNHMFRFLETNDLLRLRRVSKQFKNEAEDFIRTDKVETEQEYDFCLWDDETFDDFIKFQNVSGLPIKRGATVEFHNDNESTPALKEPFQSFLNTCGKQITHLTVSRIHFPLSSESQLLNFFDYFPNVTDLEFKYMQIKKSHRATWTSAAGSPAIKIPNSFKNLKCFVIKPRIGPTNELLTGSQAVKQFVFDFIVGIVECCLPNLEELSLPFHQLKLDMGSQQVMRLACKCLFSGPKLKLENVKGSFIEDLLISENRSREMGTLVDMINSINDKVTSLSGLRPQSFLHQFPNLEWIDCELMRMPQIGFPRQNWPKLKNVTVALPWDNDTLRGTQPTFEQAWNFFFGEGIIWKSVEHLSISCSNIDGDKISRTLSVVNSFPNLKSLSIESNINELVNLPKLWKLLPQLEELEIGSAEDITDKDFFGDDRKNPAFLNLKHLKVLEIEEFKYLNVTDNLFKKILCHMPLKTLILTSSCGMEIESISLKGLKSLLTGIFATTIEKLSFDGFILEGVSDEEFDEFEKLFRSSQMI